MKLLSREVAVGLALAGLCAGVRTASAADTAAFAFDRRQLDGWWAESVSNEPACAPENLKVAMQVDEAGRRLEMRFDRKWSTELGDIDHASAAIVSAGPRTLVIRYDDESRRRADGGPMEWELSIVAPGVYRWRETSWKPGQVNIVVGVRCPQ